MSDNQHKKPAPFDRRTGQEWSNHWRSQSNKRRSGLKAQSESLKSLLNAMGLQFTFFSPWEYPEGALRVPRTVSFEVQTSPPITIRLDNRYDQEANAYQIESGTDRKHLGYDALEQYLKDAVT